MKFRHIRNAQACIEWQFETESLVSVLLSMTASGLPQSITSAEQRESLRYQTTRWYAKSVLTEEKITELQQGISPDVSRMNLENIPWQVNETVIRGPRLLDIMKESEQLP